METFDLLIMKSANSFPLDENDNEIKKYDVYNQDIELVHPK